MECYQSTLTMIIVYNKVSENSVACDQLLSSCPQVCGLAGLSCVALLQAVGWVTTVPHVFIQGPRLKGQWRHNVNFSRQLSGMQEGKPDAASAFSASACTTSLISHYPKQSISLNPKSRNQAQGTNLDQ